MKVYLDPEWTGWGSLVQLPSPEPWEAELLWVWSHLHRTVYFVHVPKLWAWGHASFISEPPHQHMVLANIQSRFCFVLFFLVCFLKCHYSRLTQSSEPRPRALTPTQKGLGLAVSKAPFTAGSESESDLILILWGWEHAVCDDDSFGVYMLVLTPNVLFGLTLVPKTSSDTTACHCSEHHSASAPYSLHKLLSAFENASCCMIAWTVWVCTCVHGYERKGEKEGERDEDFCTTRYRNPHVW